MSPHSGKTARLVETARAAGPVSAPAEKPRTREDALRDFRTDQILAAARRVIAEVGYAEASIDRIAAAAGVARSTVYVYFDGKEDLVNRTLAQHRVEIFERVREAVRDAADFAARLRAFLGAVFAYVDEYPEFFRALMRERDFELFFEARERKAPVLDAIRTETLSVLTDIFERAAATGELAREDLGRAGALLGMLTHGALLLRTHAPGARPARAEAEEIVRGFLHGVLRARGDAPL